MLQGIRITAAIYLLFSLDFIRAVIIGQPTNNLTVSQDGALSICQSGSTITLAAKWVKNKKESFIFL